MSLSCIKKYINSVSTDAHVESPQFLIYLKNKDSYFKVQLENNLYLPFSHHEFQTKAHTLDKIYQQKIQQLKIAIHYQKFILLYNTQMLHSTQIKQNLTHNLITMEIMQNS